MVQVRFSAIETADKYLSTSLLARVKPFAEKLDAAFIGDNDGPKALRNSLTAFVIRIASAAIAFLSQVILARLMGPFEYGIFVLVWVAMVIIGSLSCLGFQTAIIRFLPQYIDQSDIPRVRGLLKSSRLFVLFSSSLAALLTIITVHFGASFLQSYYVFPLMVGVIALPMIALGDMFDGTARANGWTIRALGPTYLLRPILILIVMIAAWQLGYPINGVTALVCAVIATYTSTLIQFIVLRNNLDQRFGDGEKKIELRNWLSVALPIFLVEGFFFLLINADILMVGMLMTPADVAIYFATVKTMALVHFVFFAVKAGVANRFAARIHDEDKSELRDLARRSANWTFWPSLVMGIMVLVAGPLLLAMFGSAFTAGYPLLFIMIFGVVLRASIGPAESLLNMTGNQNICAAIFGCVLAINIALNLTLIPIYGLYGAAAATAIATCFETISLYILVRRRMGISMFAFLPFRNKEN